MRTYMSNNKMLEYDETIGRHLEDIEILKAEDAVAAFKVNFHSDLGIYTCVPDNTFTMYKSLSTNSILDKVLPYYTAHNPNIEQNKQEGWRVRIPRVTGSGNCNGRFTPELKNLGKICVLKDGKDENGKWWYEAYFKRANSKQTPYITDSVKFDSKLEAENFISQFDTNFGKYMMDQVITNPNVTAKKVLWMAEAVNPRTNKVGYKSNWIDEDFYEFFGITEEEQAEILRYITRFDNLPNVKPRRKYGSSKSTS